jgi:alkanesulfonate monooxygenase SsuD/methylene tetrahydromethanopterin reductase-like flavin-dependent oxidoreductase (luciferase family)
MGEYRTIDRSTLPLFNDNRFKLGVFCFNVSHGAAITTAEGTLTPTWAENVQIAQAADRAGWEFLLPLGRWRGFGGAINFNDRTFEVYTWAAGIAALTSQIQVFTTSHILIVHPVLAAKQGCTVDHIAGGRSALNVVAGQKEGEVAMFGLDQIEHDASYEAADEWLTIVKRLWTEDADFDFEGKYFRTRNAHLAPKPLQKPYPVVVNAGQSPTGRRFGAKHADFSFQVSPDLESLKAIIDDTRRTAWNEYKRDVGVLTHAYVVCGETEKEALDYVRHYVDERGDWEAANNLISILIGSKEESWAPDQIRTMQRALIAGWGGYPLVGTAEQIVDKLGALAGIGVNGAALTWVNFGAGINQFNEKVLPLMIQAGLRKR